MFKTMVDNKKIKILLNGEVDISEAKQPVVYTGRIDKILKRNDLPFMTTGFEIVLNKSFPWSDLYPVINFPQDFDFIRSHSSKMLYKQEVNNDVVIYEYPRRTGPECYPIIYKDSKDLYQVTASKLRDKFPNVIPAGRAGKFEYMNMDQAVLSGIDAANQILKGEYK